MKDDNKAIDDVIALCEKSGSDDEMKLAKMLKAQKGQSIFDGQDDDSDMAKAGAKLYGMFGHLSKAEREKKGVWFGDGKQ